MKSYLIGLLILIALLVSCSNEENPIEPGIGNTSADDDAVVFMERVPGEIMAGFADTCSYSFIVDFIRSIGLSEVSIYCPPEFVLKTRIDSGNIYGHLDYLKNHSDVNWAEIRGADRYPYGDIIVALFFGEISVDSAKSFVNSRDGLTISEVNYFPKHAVMETGIGLESKWIDSLKTFPVIKWADNNYE